MTSLRRLRGHWACQENPESSPVSESLVTSTNFCKVTSSQILETGTQPSSLGQGGQGPWCSLPLWSWQLSRKGAGTVQWDIPTGCTSRVSSLWLPEAMALNIHNGKQVAEQSSLGLGDAMSSYGRIWGPSQRSVWKCLKAAGSMGLGPWRQAWAQM